MVESDLRLIDPATFGLWGEQLSSLMLNFVKEEVSLINMFYLHVSNFSYDDLCEESEFFGVIGPCYSLVNVACRNLLCDLP